MQKYYLVLIALALSLSSCDIELSAGHIGKDDIVGNYLSNYKYGMLDKLSIFPEGIYVHIYVSKEGDKFMDTNAWELSYEANDYKRPKITLYGFIDRVPVDIRCITNEAGHVSLKPFDWRTYIRTGYGNIRIERCSAMHQYYIKQSDSI
ncbi:MAG: hypothetical protein ABIJ45_11465 [Candidatus Zixiibacteriota bacterium]